MRIPSQFNDQTLYGRRGRQPQSSQSYRRLIRLGVALALVVVVMQQAGDVAIYESFFGDSLDASSGGVATTATTQVKGGDRTSINAIGQNAGTEDIGTENAGAENAGAENEKDVAAEGSGVANRLASSFVDTKSLVTPEVRATAVQITQALDANAQRQWTVVLDQWQTGEKVNVIESMVQSLIDVVKQFEGIEDEQRLAWAETLDRFGQQHAAADEIFQTMLAKPTDRSAAGDFAADSQAADSTSLDPADPDSTDLDPADKARLTALLSSLDQAAVDRVVDGTIWRSADFDAFYRQLDQAPRLNRSGAMKVSVVPLMQQPKTYLGRLVLVDGKVARATKKDAAANPFGVEEYWEIWLRPSTGGDRPFVVIVPEVPDSVQKLDGETNVSRGPAIKIVGRFFKRLAFGSQFGADAAPVVVGRILGLQQPSENASAIANATATTTRPRKSRLWLVITMSLLAGISIAALVMWRTKVLAQRSRELRQSSRPAPDLSFGEPNESTS